MSSSFLLIQLLVTQFSTFFFIFAFFFNIIFSPIFILGKGRHHRIKRETISDFTLCETEDTKYLGECGNSVKVSCSVRGVGTCIFKVACILNMQNGGWDCPNPIHRFNLVICCRFTC